ncbi:MAG: hypothetical protein AB7S42_05305 [Lysobacteraceae bacterium]
MTAELPFDVVQTLKAGIRVNQAEFARMVGVSKNAVNKWVQSGLITLGPDGKVNPQEAARQLMDRADPARLRAPLLRKVLETTSDAQARAEKLAREVTSLRAAITGLESDLEAERAFRRDTCFHEDDLAKRENALATALEAEFDQLVTEHAAGRLDIALAVLFGRHLWQLDEGDLAAMRADMLAATGDTP